MLGTLQLAVEYCFSFQKYCKNQYQASWAIKKFMVIELWTLITAMAWKSLIGKVLSMQVNHTV